MPVNKKPTHLHMYKRHAEKERIFRCMDPDCSHYIDVGFLEGKRSACPFCTEPFILTEVQLKNQFPRCDACKGSGKSPKRAPVVMAHIGEAGSNIIDRLEKELEEATKNK